MIHSATVGFSIVVSMTLMGMGIWLGYELSTLYSGYMLYSKYSAKNDDILEAFGITTSIFLIILVICLSIAFCLLNRAIKVNSVKSES